MPLLANSHVVLYGILGALVLAFGYGTCLALWFFVFRERKPERGDKR